MLIVAICDGDSDGDGDGDGDGDVTGGVNSDSAGGSIDGDGVMAKLVKALSG